MDNNTRPITNVGNSSGIDLDRRAGIPLFEQLCGILRKRMTSGALREGEKLPPTRAFAIELGVSRMTVVNAYEQLVAEGYVHSKRGSGHHVAGIGEVEINRRLVAVSRPANTQAKKQHSPFRIGKPDMRLFPYRLWAQTVARICRNGPETMLSADMPFGDGKLREAVVEHVAQWRGICASPAQVIITAGSTDAIELAVRALLSPQDRIALENPGYRPIRSLAQANGHSVVNLAIDNQGAQRPGASSLTRLAVVTPSHQFPLGGAMSAGRRHAFKDWASSERAWIIEDDYDSEFRFSGQPIPAMSTFEQGQRTLYVGSFSKIFSNALRIGYIIVPEETVEMFETALRRFGSKASMMPQRPLAEFITTGKFYRHLRRVRRIYGERRKYLLERLAEDFEHIGRVTDHHAGMHVVLELADEHSDTKIAHEAARAGLSVSPLSDFCTSPKGRNGLALGYCADTPAELEAGLDQLGAVIAHRRSRIPRSCCFGTFRPKERSN